MWKAGKGDVTDGASIPPLFQPIIGGPWEKHYLPAAVMHDHYTKDEHKVRTWWSTDRMFFEAMLTGGTPILKANLMYYAVFVFGPHWGALKPGVPCGTNCIFMAPIQMTFQPADYSIDHALELKEVETILAAAEAKGVSLSLDEIRALGRARHPNNLMLSDTAYDQNAVVERLNLLPK